MIKSCINEKRHRTQSGTGTVLHTPEACAQKASKYLHTHSLVYLK